MHRLLVEGETLAAAEPQIGPAAARHLAVLRPRDGEEIELFDGCGNIRRCRWRGAERHLVPAAAAVTFPRPVFDLTLFACITKGGRWDWTIEKATELGVAHIVPVISERTIVRLRREERAAKRERWLRIAEEAARQSDAVWLPEITEAVDFADVLDRVKRTRCYVGALGDPPSPPFLEALRSDALPPETPRALFVGPEGDFTPVERAALDAIAVPVRFGPTVLRAETAALFGLSVLAAASHARQGEA